MIALDTDVLAIHYIFTWDKRYRVNEELYARVKGNAATTIHNLLELCGLFSLAGLSGKVTIIMQKYLKGKEVKLLFPAYHDQWGDYVSAVISYIGKGLSYSDALIAEALEQSELEALITWNKKHFNGKIDLGVLTPQEYLAKA